jgi:hypothetical protein
MTLTKTAAEAPSFAELCANAAIACADFPAAVTYLSDPDQAKDLIGAILYAVLGDKPRESGRCTAEVFAALFPLAFQGLTLFADYEDFRDGDDYFEDHGYYPGDDTYGNVPAPAPTGKRYDAITFADYLEEWLFQPCAEYNGEGDQEDQEPEEGALRLRAKVLAESLSDSPRKAVNATFVKYIAPLLNQYADYGQHRIETPEQQRDRRAEHAAKSLEGLACKIADKYDVKVGTVQFVHAVMQECGRQQEAECDRKIGLREDGLCIGYGVTYEQWSEEFNSPLYALVEANAVRRYLEDFCPLLFMAWQQKYPEGLTEEQIWEDDGE